MKLKEEISWLMGRMQRRLFPCIEECCYFPLTAQEKHLIELLELIGIENLIKSTWSRIGRPKAERKNLGRCFLAKSILRYPTTRDLISNLNSHPNLRLICGFSKISEIPSESTFSRVFKEFSSMDLGNMTLNSMVKEYLSGELIGHVNRDSTAIIGREKISRKYQEASKIKRKRGRPKKGTVHPPKKMNRLEIQLEQSFETSISDLPTACNRGVKKNAKGYLEAWNGFKLHADVNDLGLPLSTVITSASVHDSQVAIPLIKMTSSKVQYCYDVMDAAYDAALIRKASEDNDHVPIIDLNKRRKCEELKLLPHEQSRYKERGAVERFFGRLKDEFGAQQVMVKGVKKVNLHLMFGVVAIFADQLTKLSAS